MILKRLVKTVLIFLKAMLETNAMLILAFLIVTCKMNASSLLNRLVLCLVDVQFCYQFILLLYIPSLN